MAAIQIITGLILLGLGGEALVRGAVGTAERLKVSPFFTGLVLVGFGTSMPELVTGINAVLRDAPGIAVGNAIGSNIANTLLILGVAATIATIHADAKTFKRDAPMLAIATTAGVAFAMSGEFNRLTGVAFVSLLLGYILFCFFKDRSAVDEQAKIHAGEAALAAPPTHSLWLSLLIAVIGIGMIMQGATWMVDGSITVARSLGVSEALIGLTIVAIGTSLPELATTIVAAFRKQTDIAFGNILGSNIFNLLGILGVTAIVKPIIVSPQLVTYDLWILAGVTVLMLTFAFTDARISRREGAVFLSLYAAYMAFLVARGMGAL